jgi:hypothetical protein
MADWYYIRVQFDATPAQDILDSLGKELEDLDYDFPLNCLKYSDWCSYRSPSIGAKEFVSAFLKHGVTGRYWISSSDEYDPTDEQCVIFRPDVDPLSVANAQRARNRRERIESSVQAYKAIATAFNFSPIPIKWENMRLLSIFMLESERAEFEALL